MPYNSFYCQILLCVFIMSLDPLLFFNTKLINCLLCVLLTWLKNHRREIRMIWRIGEMLCLKADSASAWEGGTVLSLVTVSPVVCVDLNARLGCEYLHGASANGFCYLGSEAQFALFFLVQHEAMVVTCSVSLSARCRHRCLDPRSWAYGNRTACLSRI